MDGPSFESRLRGMALCGTDAINNFRSKYMTLIRNITENRHRCASGPVQTNHSVTWIQQFKDCLKRTKKYLFFHFWLQIFSSIQTSSITRKKWNTIRCWHKVLKLRKKKELCHKNKSKSKIVKRLRTFFCSKNSFIVTSHGDIHFYNC